MKHIRNFCIIAHIDHGKSTLADRMLERTHTLDQREMENQVLDSMDLEKEKGITIKSHPIQMEYVYKGEKYIFNLIDTPGHVDFSYEVSRAIASCEGALLVVDATQGIQAQTISNLYLAIEHDLEIVPVLNKIDMEAAMVDVVRDQVVDLLGCDPDDVLLASARTGEGVDAVLDAIVERIPAPQGKPDAPLQALIFDSVFNSFRGIIAYFKVENGSIRTGDRVKFVNTGKEYTADEVGVLKMKLCPTGEIPCGSVGYIISGIKTAVEVKVGDTITHVAQPCEAAIAGFEDVKPMLYAGMFPVTADQYEDLRASLVGVDEAQVFVPGEEGFPARHFLQAVVLELIDDEILEMITELPVELTHNLSGKIDLAVGNLATHLVVGGRQGFVIEGLVAVEAVEVEGLLVGERGGEGKAHAGNQEAVVVAQCVEL